jgi:hypothetical protein
VGFYKTPVDFACYDFVIMAAQEAEFSVFSVQGDSWGKRGMEFFSR